MSFFTIVFTDALILLLLRGGGFSQQHQPIALCLIEQVLTKPLIIGMCDKKQFSQDLTKARTRTKFTQCIQVVTDQLSQLENLLKRQKDRKRRKRHRRKRQPEVLKKKNSNKTFLSKTASSQNLETVTKRCTNIRTAFPT